MQALYFPSLFAYFFRVLWALLRLPVKRPKWTVIGEMQLYVKPPDFTIVPSIFLHHFVHNWGITMFDIGISIAYWFYCLLIFLLKRNKPKAKSFGRYFIVMSFLLPVLIALMNITLYYNFYKHLTKAAPLIFMTSIKPTIISMGILLSSIIFGMLLLTSKTKITDKKEAC